MLLGRLRSVPEAILLLGAALGGAACSVQTEQESSVGVFSAGIEGGEPDTEHASVFALFAQQRRGLSACTATLIAPNVLLTARHCVSNSNRQETVVCGQAEFGAPYEAKQLYASNPVLLEDSRSPWYQGAEIRVPEEGDDTCGYDVALVLLNENVPAKVASPAVPRIDRPVEDGEVYTAVGYGVNLEGVQTGRQVLSDQRIDCEPGRCGLRTPVSEFIGEAGICSGDSGGPALDAEGRIVGIVSRGAEDCSFPIYGSVASWRDMIVGFTARAAILGGYEAPFWVRSGSSDPSVLPEPTEPAVEPGQEPTSPAPLPGSEPSGADERETGVTRDQDVPEASCAQRPGGRPGGASFAVVSLLALALARFERQRRRRVTRA